MHEQQKQTDLRLRQTVSLLGVANCLPPTQLAMINRSEMTPRRRVNRVALCMAGTPWAKSIIVLRLVLITVVLWCSQILGASDPNSSQFEKSPPETDAFHKERNQWIAKETQELYRKRVVITDAVGPDVQAPSSASRQNEMTTRTQSSADRPGTHRQNFLVAALFLLAGGLAIRKLVPGIADYLNQHFQPWALAPSTRGNFLGKIRAEDEAFSEFLLAFQAGPSAIPGSVDSSTTRDPLQEFFARAPELLGALRKLLQEIGRTPNEASRQRLLADLHREIRGMKGGAGLSELLPAWQMASALEGLVKQLTKRMGNVNPSTLRTVAGAVDLLDDLCQPGVKADLLTNPPLRLLAVDDDLISRHAVSVALKKALNQPDLAENGDTALTLASRHAYDLIFLDVQMPGMDGFELCSKIHETVPNRTTPVVFITSQSDFSARAQSVLSGGSDLMGKPFLTFEITVKALTFILQGRLHGQAQTAGAGNGINGYKALSPAPAKCNPAASVGELGESPAPPSADSSSRVQNPLPELNRDFAKSRPDTDLACDAPPPLATLAAAMPNADRASSADEPSRHALVHAFLARASAHLGALRDLIQVIFQTKDENAQTRMLADFYLRLHSLTPKVDSVGGQPALRMISALEGLLKKLLENRKHCTSSRLLTVSTAVDLLNDLCVTGVEADLATNPPIRMLAVDDDPVARRAITCALQMSFEKPESAEGGEAALAAATERPFDLIFLDVQMPGMDDFTVCSKIHETVQNRTTPVVFVTGHSDFKARTQAALSGGGDLIGKPFLTAEVTIKALTFALRGRLQKRKTSTDAILQSELRRRESSSSECLPERPRWKKTSSDRGSRREELVSHRNGGSKEQRSGKPERLFHSGWTMSR
jgi:CheY-like chemotaxis protein